MNKKSIMLAIGLIIMLLPACSKPADSDTANSNSEPTMDLRERQQAANRLDPRIVQAENAFGLKLHRLLSEKGEGGNVILSPYSISVALSMAWNGSAGATADEMAEAAGWSGMDVGQVNEGNEQLARLLSGSSDGIRLQTANSLWYRKGIKLKKPFLQTGKDDYGAQITALDLSGKDAPGTINDWVSKQTEGKIDSMIDRPFDAEVVAVLINAVYFNGTWKDKFSKEATKEEDFTLGDGTVAKVPMMRRSGHYPYMESETWQAARIPYGDGRIDMLVVLPKPGSSLGELQSQLWADATPWHRPFAETSVELGLPRFKAEGDTKLADLLEQLGMKRAFDPNAADFSGMADIKPLYIGSVKHKTYIDVNEEGTEAAAATSIEMDGAAAPADPAAMTVSRPFFFAIEDTQTKAWLFIGSVTDPRA